MEKKVPERKVSLQDGDVFYVYDKRINKCVKEDCDGTVKYGLILKVSMTENEVCNCFECNKCHMKYTPYPNYVRLSNPKVLNIFNKSEVTARDEKRAEDARKQALREKREKQKTFEKKHEKNFEKNSGKSFEKKDGYKKRSNIVIAGDSKRFGSFSKPKTGGYKNSFTNSKGGYKPRTEGRYNNSYKNNINNNGHQD